jgi:hypothetical protein
MRPVRLYRWRRRGSPHGNFGDEITIPILDRIFGVEALPVGLKDAELLGAGSTLEFYLWRIGSPPAWKRFLWPADLHVWGTGTLFGQHEIRWPQRLHFHTLRGSLTAQRVGVNDIALGDPGILSSRLIRRPKKAGRIDFRLDTSARTPVTALKGLRNATWMAGTSPAMTAVLVKGDRPCYRGVEVDVSDVLPLNSWTPGSLG